jgi:hypothetical protein
MEMAKILSNELKSPLIINIISEKIFFPLEVNLCIYKLFNNFLSRVFMTAEEAAITTGFSVFFVVTG